jgi:hypothetical protein
VNAPLAKGVTVSPAVLLAADVTLTAAATSTPDDLSAEVAEEAAEEVAAEVAEETFDTPSFNTGAAASSADLKYGDAALSTGSTTTCQHTYERRGFVYVCLANQVKGCGSSRQSSSGSRT